jgi:hypothetical protein
LTRLAFEHITVPEGVFEFDANILQRRMEGGYEDLVLQLDGSIAADRQTGRDIEAVDATGRDADNKEPGGREYQKEYCVDE